MPFPFVLGTTSSFAFSGSFSSSSHPALPFAASTRRSVVRSHLKSHKRLPPAQQASNLNAIISTLNVYLPFLLAIDSGLSNTPISYNNTEEVDVILKSTPLFEWRPVVGSAAIPGREPPRIPLDSIEYEVLFALSVLAYAQSNLARVALQPIYSTSTASLPQEQRVSAIQAGTRHLLSAAGIHNYISSRASDLSDLKIPTLEILPETHKALAELSMAEATLLAVLKDDPYPAAVAQNRNKNDKEWMIKAPSIPKVRAHLFARLCLAASEHAAKAHAVLSSISNAGAPKLGISSNKVSSDLQNYIKALELSSKAKACRFFGIDADLSNQTGTALAWLAAGFTTLGVTSSVSGDKTKSGLSRLKSGWNERKEEKRIEKNADWGADAGKAEEVRVLEMLEQKWSKQNDTINTQIIPPSAPLLATMPSGREMHTIQPYVPPSLDEGTLAEMRALPDAEALKEGNADSSDEEGGGKGDKGVPGAFPGTDQEYQSGSRTATPGYY